MNDITAIHPRGAAAVAARLAFLAEIDQLKRVDRQSLITGRSRRENSAEHSWHLALFALVFADDMPGVDVLTVVRMLLIHDIVEIDVGDAPIHASAVDRADIAQRERAAARRIFGMLPGEQGTAFEALWTEFEAGETANARMAKALDRLQPLLLNTLTDGGTWAESGVTEEQVHARYGPVIEAGSPALWAAAKDRVRAHFAKHPRNDV